MNFRQLPQTCFQLVKQRPLGSATAGLVLLVGVGWLAMRPAAAPATTSFYEVARGDFLISIVEGGTLEAVDEVSVRNELEGTISARIIRIVPEGSYVKKGDLLVELDSSATQDAVNLQQIAVEKARFALIQAEQQLEIQKSTAESDLAAAELKVEFAASDLKKYLEGEAVQLDRNAQIEITNVVETLAIAKDRLEWSEKLFAKGFETKSKLDQDRLTVSQSMLKLEQAQKALAMLREFDAKKKRRELESAHVEAGQNRERVKLQGDRIKAQYQADVATQTSTLELSRTKLEREQRQLVATKIYAPQDGLVVYASSGGSRYSNESMIEEGAVVRNRQELIKLPDVSQMKLLVRIHESHINQVHVGQLAFIVLDSMPDQRLRGVVNKVGLLPDSSSRWSNPNLKVYATEILVTDALPDVKPGVSARAEIIITNLENVLTVPIQSVSTRKGQQVIFLASTPQQPMKVDVGMYNTKFIEITSGIKEGDQVLLAPPFNTEEKALGGAVFADGEEVPAGASNQVARPTRPREEATPRGNGGATRSLRDGDNGSPNAGANGGRRGGAGGSRTNSQEMLKQFDKNGDGQLDETERATMRERFSSGGGGEGRGSRSGPSSEPSAR